MIKEPWELLKNVYYVHLYINSILIILNIFIIRKRMIVYACLLYKRNESLLICNSQNISKYIDNIIL